MSQQLIDTYLDLSRRGLNGIGEVYNNHPENEFAQMGIPTINTTEDSYLAKMKSDLGLPVAFNDGESISNDIPLYPFEKRYKWVQYGIGRTISQTTLRTDQYSVNTVAMIGGELSRSHVRGENAVAAGLFNNGFNNTSAYWGPDDRPLFTNEDDSNGGGHPLESGVDNNRGIESSAGVWADVAMSSTSIVQMATEMEKQNGYKGEPMYKKGPYTLITGRHLHQDALTIVNSQLKSGTPNNDENRSNELISNVRSNSYITSQTAFFLLDNTTGHGLFKLQNQAPDHEVEYFVTNRMFLHNSVAKFMYAWFTHYGAQGTDGTP